MAIESLARATQEPVYKRITQGTHRTVTPDETLARYGDLARSMGITRLGNVTGLDCLGIPVAVAVRPNSRSISVAQGKGVTLNHALASALMEAIEGFHAEDLSARFRIARARDLASEARIVDCMCLAQTEESWSPDTEIAWIEGFDLVKKQACWVPAEIVDLDSTRPVGPGNGYFVAGSNGLASGNALLEAVSAAICEVVERDARAVWEAKRTADRARRTVDLASVRDGVCRPLIDAYEAAGLAVRIWNVTSDIGIAAFVSDISSKLNELSADLPRFRGAGCHPHRGVALARALTEAAQIRLTHITGMRDDITASQYKKSTVEEFGAALLDYMSSRASPWCFSDVPSFDFPDFAAEVEWQLHCLQNAGLTQIIVVDLTRIEYEIPVVKVIIPWLEGDPSHSGYRPGKRATMARAGQ